MNKTFHLEISMEERWIPYFVAFLRRIQQDADRGHSELVGFFADGDGDFKCHIDYFDKASNVPRVEPRTWVGQSLDVYDAG